MHNLLSGTCQIGTATRLPLAIIFGWLWATQALAAEELLRNGDFEGEFDQGMAAAWTDNSRSWADLDVDYSRETNAPHGGKACQRITCTRLDTGAVQLIPTAPVALRRGMVYRVRGWLRGDVGPVALQLRQRPSPYRVYVEQDVHACDQWRKMEYFWTSNVDDAHAGFMVRFVKEGTLWLDDLSVQVVSAEEATRLAPPPERGNLLPNGQFDLQLANWLISHGCDYWRAAEATIEHRDGNPCLRLEVPENVSIVLASDVVSVAPGSPIRLSCRLRAAAPTELTVGSTHCGTRAKLETDWQTVTASGKTRFAPKAIDHVRFNIRGPTTVWIDDIVLSQEGDQQHFRAAVVSDRHPLAFYHDGDRPVISLIASTPQTIEPKEVAWTIEDFWGNVRLAGRWLPGAGRAEEGVDVQGLGRGWYRASVRWDDVVSRVHECTFAILPPPERSSGVASSPFGAHFSIDPDGLAIARAVGVRWLRLHPPNHTKWRVVEPKAKGQWAWRDEAISLARKAGLELIGSLDRCPTWASAAPPGTPDVGFYTGTGAWLPKSWNDWEEYVAQTVRRHKDDIRIWEVWNEPNLTDWLVPREGQTRAEAYVEMLRHTYPIVKREDPEATVIGGCVAGALTQGSTARQFAWDIIDLAALELMDAFSFHQYITRSVDETSEPIDEWLSQLKAKMRVAGRELPIFNSEGGYANPGSSLTYRPCPSNVVAPEQMARWLVRQYVSQMALGVKQFYFYNFFIDGSPTIRTWQGLLEGDGQPRPNVAAYAQMTWILDGARFVRTEQPKNNAWVHHFETPRGPIAVAYMRTDHTAELRFPNASQAWDLMGAPLPLPSDKAVVVTDAPVYVRLAAGLSPPKPKSVEKVQGSP